MASLSAYYVGAWRTITQPYVYYASAWRTLKEVWVYDGSVWRSVWSAITLAVSPVGGTISRKRSITTYAGVQFNADGIEYWSAVTGGPGYTQNKGAWLDVGTVAEVWVHATLDSGAALYTGTLGTRLQLSTSRSWSNRDTTLNNGAVTSNLTFRFYDAASGGNLLNTTSYTLTADRSDIV